MKKIINFILLFFLFCTISKGVFAAENETVAALKTLQDSIVEMSHKINAASSQMMMLADLLICNSKHGIQSYTTISIPGIIAVHVHLIQPWLLLSGLILYVLGFFVLMIASFYMFDVAFNISVTLLVLPLGLALWPFGWTKDKIKPMIESILYYTGVFIFLPLGILLAVELVKDVASNALGSTDFITAFENDDSDAIGSKFSLFSFTFLKILLCYVVSIRLIPLVADEFCTHFFGSSLLGSPISTKLSQMTQAFKRRAINKITRHGGNIAKVGAGTAVQSLGKSDGNAFQRMVHGYGKYIAKNKKQP